METKREIFTSQLHAFIKGSRTEKSAILDAVCRTTGLHRKTAIRRFGRLQKRHPLWRDRRGGREKYGADVTAALHEAWALLGEICAERLHPQLAECVRALRAHREWHHTAAATALLLSMSCATMKRRIERFEKLRGGRGRSTTKSSGIREIIPVRRGPWDNPAPGFGEVDSVAHCGESIAGDYCYSVQYTDVATIWTCLAGQWNKGEAATQKSIERVAARLPFPLRGIDPDSGGEFINWHLKGWCDAHQITMTRTRPYMKNDHARIEQKNYQNVRKFVGYARFGNPAQATVLNELYDALEDYLNFFVPSMKCVGKERTRSGSKRLYDVPQTAYRRVVAHPDIPAPVKEALRAQYATLNPVALKRRIDTLTKRLFDKKRYGNNF